MTPIPRSARPSSARNSMTALASGARKSSGISITGLQIPLASRCVGKHRIRMPCVSRGQLRDEKLMNGRCNNTTWPHHAFHFSYHLVRLRKHIQRQRGNSRVERAVRKGHLADVTGLICDVWMGSQLPERLPGTLQRRLAHHVMAAISECLRQDSSPAGNVENPGASRDTS